jgi:hypothetical protein
MEHTVSDHYGSRPPAAKGRKTNSGLLTGIEIELERIVLLRNPVGWKKEADNSLKDNGMEFTLPVWSTNVEEWLNELFSCFNQAESSPRCSVHVHANVTDFTLPQLKALILLYVIFERVLYRFSGKRWNNIYCVPVQTWAVGMDLDIYNFDDLRMVFPKYSGINIFPDQARDNILGTVEFRHMAGNKNVMYIKTWVEIIALLVKYAQEQNYNDMKARISDMRHTSQYWELFKEIFKDKAPALNYSDFDKDVETGITFAKLISGN